MENSELNRPDHYAPLKSVNIPPPTSLLTVGILRAHKKALSQTSSLNLMVYMAKNFNIELYFFTPQDFNPEDKTVRATLMEGNTRVEKIIPLPKIIYNTFSCFANETREDIKSLIIQESYFVRKRLSMTKTEIYNILLADGKFKEFLIESHLVKSFNHFQTLFKQYGNEVILKPIHGKQGTDVIKITFNEKGYFIKNDKEVDKFFKTADEFRKYYNQNFLKSGFILQPYFNSRTKDGNPFDIRIHARRAAEGKFKVFFYPRIGGRTGGVISNILTNGHTMPFLKFLKREFGNDSKLIQQRLTDLGNIFPDHFQSLLPKIVTSMGLDVGIQRRGDSYEIKIFEVNVGGPAVDIIATEVAFTNLEYLQYLGKCLAEGTLKNRL